MGRHTTAFKDSRFRGVFTAIITPFSADGLRIDFDRLATQIQRQGAAGVTGVVIAGTTGESPTLTEAEYSELIRRGVRLAHEVKILAIAGTGSNSTAHAVHLQRVAAEAGADGALSVNPYYNKPTQEGLFQHFSSIAAAADLPVMVYNIPGRTGVAISLETMKRLAEVAGVVAVKDATGHVEMASDVCASCPALAVLSGDDPLTLPMMAVGAVGVVSVVSNVVPERVVALCRAVQEGRWAVALEIHRELLPAARALFAETNPIPVKGAMSLLGLDSGALRLPMTGPQEGTMSKLRAVFAECAV